MQIQIISTTEEMQSAFNQMFAEAIKTLPQNETPPPPRIVSGDVLSSEIGVTIQTIIRWRNKNKIPFFRIGSSVRYDLNAVLKSLEQQKGLKRG